VARFENPPHRRHPERLQSRRISRASLQQPSAFPLHARLLRLRLGTGSSQAQDGSQNWIEISDETPFCFSRRKVFNSPAQTLALHQIPDFEPPGYAKVTLTTHSDEITFGGMAVDSLKMNPMRKLSAMLFLICVLAPLPILAKPKKRVYNNTPQEVFDAALRTARERQVVTYVDEKNLMIAFETGMSMMSYGFVANASVEPLADGKADLLINVQNKTTQLMSFNAGDRMADKFFQQVAEELARKSKKKTAPNQDATEADVLLRKPINSSDESSKVVVNSFPDGGDISIDGAFVGNAPSTVTLSPGKHAIQVTVNGYKAWSKELTVFANSEVKLKASLIKE
jgi:hypothetical protein